MVGVYNQYAYLPFLNEELYSELGRRNIDIASNGVILAYSFEDPVYNTDKELNKRLGIDYLDVLDNVYYWADINHKVDASTGILKDNQILIDQLLEIPLLFDDYFDIGGIYFISYDGMEDMLFIEVSFLDIGIGGYSENECREILLSQGLDVNGSVLIRVN